MLDEILSKSIPLALIVLRLYVLYWWPALCPHGAASWD